MSLVTPFGDYDSPSPYPPSSPSADSDGEYSPPPSNMGLRTSIATVPESRLRAIMVKLADSNPRFQRAIMKELAYAQPFGDSPPTTPTATRQRKSRRSKTRRNCKNLSVSTVTPVPMFQRKRSVVALQPLYQDDCVYHPGQLEEEVYEFLSASPEDVAFKVVRTITMWSCCDEEEWSPGCMAASHDFTKPEHDSEREGIMEFSHPDVFPDSDLEERYDTGFNGMTARSLKQ
ncbi:hypothetical protein B0H34DRAFT_801820 [Crassisporium funariophilum]|nr:hypothetical protein B0H34DRAFT_801820 [Crassisporium funariophilum]